MASVHRRISESTFQTKVLKWLKSLDDTYVFKVVRANRSGVHDIIVCHRGSFKSIEVKRETGKMTELQKLHSVEVGKAGGRAYCVRPSTFEDFKKDFIAD